MANSFITDKYHRLRNLKAAQPGSVWIVKRSGNGTLCRRSIETPFRVGLCR